ncbi:MAG: imidazole glycerol phosphate synthase cyclase subunit, partial [Firmicutes bacterium]|nr:imidazole glycerol phosphate synthase cyclase subunit [Bacillota bacterium]
MPYKRIIPCLDIKDGRVVKGINFVNFRDAGEPSELAAQYVKEGADELVFLDIAASSENRGIMLDTVKRVAKKVTIPFTVGGGVRTVEDVRAILAAGADKVSISSAAIKNPRLISDAANMFGSKSITLAVDVKRNGDCWNVYINGGKTNTSADAIKWIVEAKALGAGEVLLN